MEPPAAEQDDPGQLTKVLLAHEQARARAWIGKNRQALEVLLAPEFMEINTLGRLTKKDVIASLFPALTLNDFVIENPVLIPASADSAILTYRCREDLTVHGQRVTGVFYIAAHYVRRGRKWLLLLWQITPYSGTG